MMAEPCHASASELSTSSDFLLKQEINTDHGHLVRPQADLYQADLPEFDILAMNWTQNSCTVTGGFQNIAAPSEHAIIHDGKNMANEVQYVEIQYERFPLPPNPETPAPPGVLEAEHVVPMSQEWDWSSIKDDDESDHTISPCDSSGSSHTQNILSEKLWKPRDAYSRWQMRRKRSSSPKDLRPSTASSFYQNAKSNVTRTYLRLSSRSDASTTSDDNEDMETSFDQIRSETSPPVLPARASGDRRFGTWPISRPKPRPRLMDVPGVESRWDLLSSPLSSTRNSWSERESLRLDTLEEEPKSRFSDSSDDDDISTVIARRLRPTWLARGSHDTS